VRTYQRQSCRKKIEPIIPTSGPIRQRSDRCTLKHLRMGKAVVPERVDNKAGGSHEG
jgi:hypothetical protein